MNWTLASPANDPCLHVGRALGWGSKTEKHEISRLVFPRACFVLSLKGGVQALVSICANMCESHDWHSYMSVLIVQALSRSPRILGCRCLRRSRFLCRDKTWMAPRVPSCSLGCALLDFTGLSHGVSLCQFALSKLYTQMVCSVTRASCSSMHIRSVWCRLFRLASCVS